MLGHDDVGEHVELIFFPGFFEGLFEDVAALRSEEVRPSLVAAEGDVMVVTESLVPLQADRHGGSVPAFDTSGCPILDTVSSWLGWVLSVRLREAGRAIARCPP